jgi:hypothetical protein
MLAALSAHYFIRRPGEAMSGLLWFIAGFVSCIAVSGLGFAFLVWRTPPASEQPEKGLQSAQSPREEEAHPRPSVLSIVRRQARKSGR